MNQILLTGLLTTMSTGLYAQHQFPQNDFKNPLRIPISLAGSFAECRPNHFHTGIDLKTSGKENLPVLAAAEGYISRITISHAGYGNCLYVTHPNGYTTVYGHLNRFMPEVMRYVQEEQYRQQKWALDITLPPGTFRYRQGQQIAYSGNTGGSTAPHLHFEIRDTRTEAVYNALLFGLSLRDHIAPKAGKLAFYDASQYYDRNPVLHSLQPAKKGSKVSDLVTLPFQKVMVGIDAKDYMDGSSNWLGVYQLALYMDEQLLSKVSFDELHFDQNRAVNAYADYRSYRNQGIWLHGLYRLPNNPLDLYTDLKNKGVLDISDGLVHTIRIQLTDASGNTRTIQRRLRYQTGQKVTPCKGRFNAGIAHQYNHYTGNMYCNLPASVLYDDVCAQIKEQLQPGKYSSLFEVLRPELPAHDYFELGIKLMKPVPDTLRGKLIFIHKIPKANLPGSNSQEAQVAQWQSGFAVARVRSFGAYSVDIDTTAPQIKRLDKQKHRLQFTVTDDRTSVRHFDGYLNDQWVCFSRKGNTYTYIPDDYCPAGTATVTIVARDESGNEARYSGSFTP